MFRVAVGPLDVYWKTIRDRLYGLYVALLKYPLWPSNLFFSVVFFPVILGMTLFGLGFSDGCFCWGFFVLISLHLVFGGRHSVFQEHAVCALQTSSRRSRTVQTVAAFTLHTRLKCKHVHPVQGTKQDFCSRSNAQYFFLYLKYQRPSR